MHRSEGGLGPAQRDHRAKVFKQQVHVLDPFGVAADVARRYAGGFNPLSILRPDSPTLVEDAGLIADALVVGGGSDPHWDESA